MQLHQYHLTLAPLAATLRNGCNLSRMQSRHEVASGQLQFIQKAKQLHFRDKKRPRKITMAAWTGLSLRLWHSVQSDVQEAWLAPSFLEEGLPFWNWRARDVACPWVGHWKLLEGPVSISGTLKWSLHWHLHQLSSATWRINNQKIIKKIQVSSTTCRKVKSIKNL